jgi:ABC-type thiamine transport system ATPase subunit
MIDLVKSIQQEHQLIMIMVTHNPEDASKICNKTCFIKDGRVILS